MAPEAKRMRVAYRSPAEAAAAAAHYAALASEAARRARAASDEATRLEHDAFVRAHLKVICDKTKPPESVLLEAANLGFEAMSRGKDVLRLAMGFMPDEHQRPLSYMTSIISHMLLYQKDENMKVLFTLLHKLKQLLKALELRLREKNEMRAYVNSLNYENGGYFGALRALPRSASWWDGSLEGAVVAVLEAYDRVFSA